MNILARLNLKWIAYGLELFLVYVIQCTPNLLPSFLGVKPLLLVVTAISISMFEGDGPGMWIGLSAGLLMDLQGGNKGFGFNAIVLMLICFACGSLVVFLMRNNIVSAVVLALSGLFVIGLLRWFFFYVLTGAPKAGYYLYAVLLPQIVYTTLAMPIAFYFNRAISSHLASEE